SGAGRVSTFCPDSGPAPPRLRLLAGMNATASGLGKDWLPSLLPSRCDEVTPARARGTTAGPRRYLGNSAFCRAGVADDARVQHSHHAGVAGFEPAASSSRIQPAHPAALSASG